MYAGFTGLPGPHHVPGLIQHGWTPVSPVSTHFADLAGSAPAGNLFVWSHACRGWSERQSKAETGFATTPIGSPALYLLDMIRSSGSAPEVTLPTVVFPFHGTRLLSVDGNQAAYAKEILEREGPSIICMHVDDLQRPELVKAWTDSGHSLITAGERRDPDFLARIMWLVMSAEKVVSNRLATALFYAAAAGTRVSIYGPHFQISGITETSSEEYLRRLWPEFYDANATDAVQLQIANDELGRDFMLSPEQLKQTFGWTGRSLRPFFQYWLHAPLSKAQAILGLRSRDVQEVVNEVKLSPWHFLKNPFEHLPKPLPRTSSTKAVEPIFIEAK